MQQPTTDWIPPVLDYQKTFIDFALEREVLRFGTFHLKSGRISPYFFNTGRFNSGTALRRLAQGYVAALEQAGIAFDLLFGPAYKGIPLASALAVTLAEASGRDVGYAFDRKEAKDHGEGGGMIGAPLAGRRAVIVDDVISSGISIREAAAQITAAGGTVVAATVALDRMERGRGTCSALDEVAAEIGAPVVPIITLDDLTAYLAEHDAESETLRAIRAYRQQYGGRQGGA